MRPPLLLFSLILAACETPAGLRLPASAVRFDPPAMYGEWWKRTESCSGSQAHFDAVTWYTVPNATTIPGSDGLLGVWLSDGNRIVLAGDIDQYGDMVRHEMLHAILGARGAKHPRAEFVVKCGGVVTCTGQCLIDGGPAAAAPSGAIEVPASALEVTASLDAAPNPETWDGYFFLIVTVRNPSDHPVKVQLPNPPTDFGRSIDIDWRLEQPSADIEKTWPGYGPEIARFAPGEVKQFLFDLHGGEMPDRYHVPRGTWTIRAAYQGVWAPSTAAVTVP